MMKAFASTILFLAACAPEPAASGLPADFAALVPADATLLVQLRSLSELTEEAESFRMIAAPEEALLNARELLADMLEPIGYADYAASVLLDQPIGLSLSLGAQASEPVLTLIVPVRDPGAILARLESEQGGTSARVRGSYVAVSMGEPPAVSDAISPLLDGFPPGLFSMRADLGALVKAFRPIIDVGLAQFAPLMQEAMEEDPMPMGDPAEFVDWYLLWIRNALDSVERLDLALDVKETDLTLDVRLENRAGSPLALLARPDQIDFAALAGKVDPDAPMQFMMSYELAGPFQKFSGIYDGMFDALNQQSGVPPEVAAAFGAYVGSLKEILPMLGRDLAGSYGLGPDGL